MKRKTTTWRRAAAGLWAASLLLTVNGPASTPDIRPCDSEDQRTECVWDARHQGNGIGASFYVTDNGTRVYLSHAFAHYFVGAQL